MVLCALNFCGGDPGFSLQFSNNFYLSGSSTPTSASQIHFYSMGEPKAEKDVVGDWEGMNAVNAFCLKIAHRKRLETSALGGREQCRGTGREGEKASGSMRIASILLTGASTLGKPET